MYNMAAVLKLGYATRTVLEIHELKNNHIAETALAEEL